MSPDTIIINPSKCTIIFNTLFYKKSKDGKNSVFKLNTLLVNNLHELSDKPSDRTNHFISNQQSINQIHAFLKRSYDIRRYGSRGHQPLRRSADKLLLLLDLLL